ncbi:MAG: permease-like cell division protein FtsX [Egibacteraceae bacterium]
MARWRYAFNEVGLGLRRNLLMTAATIVTVTLSLVLLGAGLLVGEQVDLARRLFYAQVEVSIYLQDGISGAQRTSLEQELRANPEVEDLLFESKQQAYQTYQRIFAENESMRSAVTPEMLPASFRVKLVDPERFDIIRSQYQGYPGVDDVKDQREVLERFFQLMNKLRSGAWWVAGFQGLAAAALVANTIRITAFARREQTGIMKLVGATNWYIRLPFVLEGVIAGVAGALLAGGVLVVANATLVGGLRREIGFFPFIGTGEFLAVIPVLVLIGAVVSAVASLLSLQRFLDV